MSKLFTIDKKRNGALDIYRLLFSFAIMYYHVFDQKHFIFGWIYVEFFLILTGALTANKMFFGNYHSDFAVSYSFSKFKRFFPYVLIATIMQYSLEYLTLIFIPNGFDVRELVNYFESFIIENLLLYSAGLPAHGSPVWFLSSMFLVFPLFVFLLIRYKNSPLFYKYIVWVVPALFYGKYGIIDSMIWPQRILRALSGLLLGAFAYVLSRYIKEKNRPVITSTVSFISLSSTLILTFFNFNNMYLIVIIFIVGISCLLSGICFSKNLHLPAFLAEISMIIYLLQWPVSKLLLTINSFTVIRYYIITIALSFFLLSLVTIFSQKQKKD